MRVLKFRAWDTLNKRMSYNQHFVLSNMADIVPHPEAFGHFEIMQYTGLEDKNGKEIYEGDIVNLIPNGYVPELAQVLFDGGSFLFAVEDEGKNFLYTRGFDRARENHLNSACEVIGNIYEHSELIKRDS